MTTFTPGQRVHVEAPLSPLHGLVGVVVWVQAYEGLSDWCGVRFDALGGCTPVAGLVLRGEE